MTCGRESWKSRGLRLTLGAPQRRVAWDVLRTVMMSVAIGLVAGLPLALGAARAAGGLLFGVAPTPRRRIAGSEASMGTRVADGVTRRTFLSSGLTAAGLAATAGRSTRILPAGSPANASDAFPKGFLVGRGDRQGETARRRLTSPSATASLANRAASPRGLHRQQTEMSSCHRDRAFRLCPWQ